jgi:hypothetical protein
MKGIAFFLVPLLAMAVVYRASSFAKSTDGETRHYNLDADRGKVEAISDRAKKTGATSHLKAAYTDMKENRYTDCLSEPKAAEALLQ